MKVPPIRILVVVKLSKYKCENSIYKCRRDLDTVLWIIAGDDLSRLCNDRAVAIWTRDRVRAGVRARSADSARRSGGGAGLRGAPLPALTKFHRLVCTRSNPHLFPSFRYILFFYHVDTITSFNDPVAYAKVLYPF